MGAFMTVYFPTGSSFVEFMTLNVSSGFLIVCICSTFLSEVLNWYCYENPEDLSVAMSHKNYPKRVW